MSEFNGKNGIGQTDAVELKNMRIKQNDEYDLARLGKKSVLKVGSMVSPFPECL